MTTAKDRILVTSHGHPDFSLGGGEIAAYNLFKAYQTTPGVESATFLARYDRGHGATGAISMRRTDEYLWEQGISDWFDFRTANSDSLHRNFADLIRKLRPTVLHAHHFAHLGLEYIAAVKQIDPSIKIILTLHEFLAICLHNGQMVKTGSHRLCSRESLHDCNRCFPERSLEDFWLRKHRIQAYFRMVDHFVAPSDFLRDRYIAWGIPADRITTIENGQASLDPLPPRPLRDGEGRNRFGFFGQVNPYKGVELLLRALNGLTRDQRRKLVLEVHGSNLEGQEAAFQTRIAELRAPLEREGVLQWIGPYEPAQVTKRMAGVDWVVIPSIWWENSPMVIQEAFAHGRPVLGSDIGGMAEKVKDGISGRHVQVGNANAWGNMLISAANTPGEWERLRAGIKAPLSYAECAEAHMGIVQQVRCKGLF